MSAGTDPQCPHCGENARSPCKCNRLSDLRQGLDDDVAEALCTLTESKVGPSYTPH